MKGFDALPAPLRPLWIPFLVLVVMLVVSNEHFSLARRAYMPPAPETLTIESVRIDQVEHSTSEGRNNTARTRHLLLAVLMRSDDWPGITFRATGAAIGVNFEPPFTYDLYLDRDLREQAARRAEMPNYFPTIEVHGVRDGSQMLADPVPHYQAASREKQRLEMYGYGALVLALGALTILGFQLRGLWRRAML